MSRKIPRATKDRAFRLWLQGYATSPEVEKMRKQPNEALQVTEKYLYHGEEVVLRLVILGGGSAIA